MVKMRIFPISATTSGYVKWLPGIAGGSCRRREGLLQIQQSLRAVLHPRIIIIRARIFLCAGAG